MGTSQNYWDCDCEVHYIHAQTCPACPICGALREEGYATHSDEIGVPERMAPDYTAMIDTIDALEVAYAELENHTHVPGVKDHVIPCILSALKIATGGAA